MSFNFFLDASRNTFQNYPVQSSSYTSYNGKYYEIIKYDIPLSTLEKCVQLIKTFANFQAYNQTAKKIQTVCIPCNECAPPVLDNILAVDLNSLEGRAIYWSQIVFKKNKDRMNDLENAINSLSSLPARCAFTTIVFQPVFPTQSIVIYRGGNYDSWMPELFKTENGKLLTVLYPAGTQVSESAFYTNATRYMNDPDDQDYKLRNFKYSAWYSLSSPVPKLLQNVLLGDLGI